MTHRVHKSQNEHNIYDMKTMRPPGFHHNGFVATHALGHIIYIYIYTYYVYIYIYIYIKKRRRPNTDLIQITVVLPISYYRF